MINGFLHGITRYGIGLLKSLALLLLIVGGVGFVEPAYMSLKASLSQHLLETAWRKSVAYPQQNIKPWPWADTWPVFKLRLRKSSSVTERETALSDKESQLSRSYVVLADASGESLAFAPGLVTTTVYPGDLGNSLIAAHKDTHFSFMEAMTYKDSIEVEYKDGSTYRFEIDHVEIIDSRQESPIININESRVTLVTCYPFEQTSQQTPFRMLMSGIMVANN
ncbi:class GN sortase [Aliikangiella marina]|uniref:Class GN sortase n=1 Tax=Aliikangiella marina TaxID=1712262 RepID=A0A545T7H9_9GAMM|nr:class GN sortase [Aliikangiella marina]TQV73183.1 class GN sortase [Aliikangiella marina]